MRRALPGALVLGVAIAMAVGADRTAAQATARVERTPQLFIVRVPGAFDDVLRSSSRRSSGGTTSSRA
jgi:hypothetical protein